MRQVISKVTNGKADVVNYNYLAGTEVEDAFLETQEKIICK
jgi:hypothetical protein